MSSEATSLSLSFEKTGIMSSPLDQSFQPFHQYIIVCKIRVYIYSTLILFDSSLIVVSRFLFAEFSPKVALGAKRSWALATAN